MRDVARSAARRSHVSHVICILLRFALHRGDSLQIDGQIAIDHAQQIRTKFFHVGLSICVCVCVWDRKRATRRFIIPLVNYHGIVVCRRCVRSLEKRKLHAGLDMWYGMVVISFASGVSFRRLYEARCSRRLVNGSKRYEKLEIAIRTVGTLFPLIYLFCRYAREFSYRFILTLIFLLKNYLHVQLCLIIF